MTDPYYKEMKHHKREYDWVSNCVYANYKIPTKCICGGAITVEADDRGRNYYVCKDFKNDGLHIRHDCLTALEEELDCLRSQYAEEVSLRRELQFELAQMREEIKELKQLIMPRQNDVAKYKRFFYSLSIVGERTEQQLIQLAKARLKEEIRDGLETDEFATLEVLFEEAEEVEEGLKETPPSSPGKRRRTSSDHRSSKRARKAEKKGDPEDEGYGYDGEGATGLKDDEEGDYWEWMQMETDMDDDASDRTDDTLGSGQFRMDNYPDSSGTDSSTSDSD
uniref:Zinc finger GRF-type domain-containing protein n=1 Tax=Brassica campestris TaxID=3711 RepID=M4F1H7_BRACM